jgi:hypothetical protein
MESTVDLKSIERRAYRFTFQDGILDITLGLLMLGFSLASIFDDNKPIRLIITALIVIIPLTVFILCKRRITIPRIGFVKFGPKRKAKRKKIAIIITIAVLVSASLAVMAMTNAMPQYVVEGLKGYGSAIAFVLLTISMFSVGAFYEDLPRLYFYGLLFGSSIFVSECYYNKVGIQIHSSIAFGLTGLIMSIMGFRLLVKFLHDYPKPSGEAAVGSR